MTLANPNKLPDGAKVTAPGVWQLPMAVYHSDCCAGPSISSSGLRTIWSQSPAHFFHDSPYNPNRPEPKDRPHFSLGRAAHHLLYLGETGFSDEFVVRPSEWADWRTKEARLWRDAAILDGKTVLTDGEIEAIKGMAVALGKHPLVRPGPGQSGILDGAVERSLIWQDEKTGVWLKSRPDNIPSGSGLFADLKTAESVSDESLERSLASFGYHMQAALVAMASEAVLGLPADAFTFAFVWVEKAPPHCVRVTVLTGEDLERGRMQLRRSIDQFAACVKSGVWPGPGGDRRDAEYLQLPAWATKRIDQQLEVAAAETNDNAREPEKAA